MRFLRRGAADALLEGRPAPARAGLSEVERFVNAMRLESAAMPAPAPRRALAAIFDGRRPLGAASDARAIAGLVREHRHRRIRTAGAALATGAVLFGGVATAGALPGALQHASADLVSHVGINIPGHSNSRPPRAPGRVTPRSTPTPAPTSSHPRVRATVPGVTVPNPAPTTVPATEGNAPSTTIVIAPTLPTLPHHPIVTPPILPVTLPTIPRLTLPRG